MSADLSHLPLCPVRHLPIPYSSGTGQDGRGLFGVNDLMAKLCCAAGRLCGVCGRPLDGAVAFVALGVVPLARPVFSDPPNHPACALDSMLELCPYITRAKVRSRTDPGRAKDGWLLITAADFEVVMPGTRPGLVAFAPRGLITVRRFRYDAAGLLAEAGP